MTTLCQESHRSSWRATFLLLLRLLFRRFLCLGLRLRLLSSSSFFFSTFFLNESIGPFFFFFTATSGFGSESICCGWFGLGFFLHLLRFRLSCLIFSKVCVCKETVSIQKKIKRTGREVRPSLWAQEEEEVNLLIDLLRFDTCSSKLGQKFFLHLLHLLNLFQCTCQLSLQFRTRFCNRERTVGTFSSRAGIFLFRIQRRQHGGLFEPFNQSAPSCAGIPAKSSG